MKKSMNFLEFTQKFSSEEICIQTLEHVRWGGKVVSPFDPTSKVYKCKNHKYKCKNTNRYFTVRTGTYFANSNLSFMKWFYVIWLITCNKRGISSCQISRDIGVSQKTAWHMLHKVRKAMAKEKMIIALKEKLRLMSHLQVEKMQTDIRIKKWRDARGEVLKTKFLFLD